VDLMQEQAAALRPDRIVAIESRGFILAAPLADRLGVGLVPVRKKGKLPWRHVACTYDLEYGTDTVEMHEDALGAGERALIVDDVIATGGTARAAGQLVRTLGAQVAGYAFLIELSFLKGRQLLEGDDVRALIVF
jgi:adenine phosphoribosyltransferase